ncbi:MAG: methyl-accepting chemotaxis protein [Limnobacter sp.]|nr:methyl-accepting chemotaxis protein [Limnobacter sp.]
MRKASSSFNALSLPYKCTVVILPLLLAFVSLFYNSYQNTSSLIGVAENELAGTKALVTLQTATPDILKWINSTRGPEAAKLQKTLQALESSMPPAWVESHKAAAEFAAEIASPQAATPAIKAAQTTARLQALTRHIADESELTLDPLLPSYYLMSPLAFIVPTMVEELTILKSNLTNARDEAAVLANMVATQNSSSIKLKEVDDSLAKSAKAGATIRPEIPEQLAKVKALSKSIQSMIDKDTENAGQGEELNLQPKYDLIDQTTDALLTLNQSINQNLQSELAVRIGKMTQDLWMSWIAPLTGLSLAFLLAIGVFKTLNRGIGELVAQSQTLASGDLSKPIEVRGGPELESLRDALETIRTGQSKVMAQLQSAAAAMRQTVEQLGHTSVQVHNNVSQQNDSATAVAASIEQLTVSIEQVHAHASTANQLASNSGQLSVNGQHSVLQANDAMGQIEKASTTLSESIHKLGTQSDNISAIVKVIHDIASQTNLLALNAAIEAARAGEQGRGFAVVADEVRKLAEKTRESTGNIESLVVSIQHEAQQAVQQVSCWVDLIAGGQSSSQQANQHMKDISHSATETERAVHEITSALQEQTSASTLIAQKVEQIASMTEEGQAAVQEVQEVMRQLSGVSDKVNHLIGQFKLQAQ